MCEEGIHLERSLKALENGGTFVVTVLGGDKPVSVTRCVLLYGFLSFPKDAHILVPGSGMPALYIPKGR